MPVYSWVLIGSGSALLTAFLSICTLKKKGNEESTSQHGESYSDVSNDWSSNYNSHWEQNDESQSTPKRKNYRQAEETTIV